MRRDPFQAIADPQRRSIIKLLSVRPLHLNAIADNFNISRPAISRHIKILQQCGLITVRQLGRERFCEAKLAPLHEVWDWAGQYKAFWNARLDALGTFLENDSPPPKIKSVKKIKPKRK